MNIEWHKYVVLQTPEHIKYSDKSKRNEQWIRIHTIMLRDVSKWYKKIIF